MAVGTAQPRLAIIGGGISGLVLAMALHDKGITSTIYEQASHFGEIGAGVAFGSNAIRAMHYCSPKVYEAFTAVATSNQLLPNKEGVQKWFDFVDGYHEDPAAPQGEKYMFNLQTANRGGCHRAHFLDELIKHAPKDTAQFGKRLDTITEDSDGTLKLRFHDGTIAEADVVIGCDGIKSKVRQLVFPNHPCAHALYTHKKAYRGLIPMDRAISLLGPTKAQNSHMHLGHGGHILTFPVAKGTLMNVVAFRQDDGDWPSDSKLTLPSSKEKVLEDYKDFNGTARKILEMLEPDLDVWGIFDTGTHPCPQFNDDKICLLGDAAHATAPHHGAGAGFCVEDCAVMSTLLSMARTKEDYAQAFACFSAQRKERTQWLVQSSRITGNMYDWMHPPTGSDAKKIEEELSWRAHTIWDVDTDGMIRSAREDMERRLNGVNGGMDRNGNGNGGVNGDGRQHGVAGVSGQSSL
ncbi:MAG: hypothetical protein Q9162_003213 [Coniocarpon cinnabarinum]